MKRLVSVLIIFVVTTASQAFSQPVQEVVSRMVEQIRRNLDVGDDYGSTQEVLVKKLKDGKVDNQELRVYRTIWIHGRPFSELVRVNNRQLTAGQKSDELKRKQQFLVNLQKPQNPDSGFVAEVKAVRWWEIIDKYDFALLDADEGASYVLSFRPKNIDLSERNRVEKILNHLAGKIWLDEDCNVTKAVTELSDPVHFAWGIAKLDEMKVQFQQQELRGAFLPAALHVAFKAHVGFMKKEHQDITAQWSEMYPKPYQQGPTIQASAGSKK